MRHGILTLTLLLLSATLANAAVYTIHPDGSGDYPTIQDALNVAADFDTLRLGDGTFMDDGNRELLLDHNQLLIESISSNPEDCVIHPEGLAFGEVNQPVRFRGITFAAGDAFHSTFSETIEFENCRFEQCSGISSLHTTRMTNCTVRESAGPVTINGWRVELTDCLFENNHTDLVFGKIIIATGCEFRDNTATIAMIEMRVLAGEVGWGEIDACRFTGNMVEYCLLLDGGGFWVNVTHCIFAYNSKTCIYNIEMPPGSLNVENSSFVGNGTQGGADLMVFTSGIVAERCIFAYRPAGQVADNAYANWPGSVNCTDCDVFGNMGGDWTALIDGQFGAGCNMSEVPLLCDMLHGDFMLYDSSPCLSQNNVCGVLIGAEGQGCVDVTAVDSAPGVPTKLSAHPNPFNPRTTIKYTLDEAGAAVLRVYDIAGRHVRTLVDEYATAGEHETAWDGKDAQGASVAGGVYVARLETARGTESEKLLLAR